MRSRNSPPLPSQTAGRFLLSRSPLKGYVFPSDETATGFIGYPQKQWKRVVKRAGLTNLRPHDLRRSFASAMLKNVAALPAVGKALGHMDLSTTLIYARTTAETVREGVHSAAGKLLEFQQQDEAEAA